MNQRKHSIFLCVLGVLCGSGFTGCASASRTGREILDGKRAGWYVPDIPGERQATAGSCGGNALASLLGRYGIAAGQRELDAKLYVPSIRGSLTVDLWREARSRGLRAWETDALSSEDLRQLLARRVTPLVLMKTCSGPKVLEHYVVLTGFDVMPKRWIAQTGLGREAFLEQEDFEASWSSAGRWVLLAAPPETEEALWAWVAAVPKDWRSWNNLADFCVRQDRLPEAQEAVGKAFGCVQAFQGNARSEAMAYCLDTRGTLRQAQGRTAEAMEDFREALRLAEEAKLPAEVMKEIRAHAEALGVAAGR